MSTNFDVAIVGGGPAGLSAALLLGRCRRSVVVCDHGRPRNRMATAVHGFLGLDGVAPASLRSIGREQCARYGVSFFDCEVVNATNSTTPDISHFELELRDGQRLHARKLLIATGVVDQLPEIPNIADYYGKSVHHCPYCDGWEHRDQRLVSLGHGSGAVDLALMLLAWSPRVTVCTNGAELSPKVHARLEQNGIGCTNEPIARLAGADGQLTEVIFASGKSIACDALFFSAAQGQRSPLAKMLGCECDEKGLAVSMRKQHSGVPGLFLAGDADGDVQFAIVAAAEGAVAAVAINHELQSDDEPGSDRPSES